MALNFTDFNWNGANFLLADDDFYTHLLLEKAFKRIDANLIHANNGTQAIDIVMKNDIVLALIDIVMPDINGFEVAANIKLYKPEVICVAFTGDKLNIQYNNIKTNCFDKVLFKPLLPYVLLREINELLTINSEAYK